MKVRSPELGFTMVELVMVILIAAILTAIGVPSYKYVTTSNRISAEINGLLGDVQFARYEAIKEGLSVEICAAGVTVNTCTGATSTAWQNGWIVVSNAADPVNPGGVLRRQVPFTNFNSNDTLTSSTGVGSLTFNREGFLTTSTGAAGTTSSLFSLYDPTHSSSFTRCLVVGIAGAMSTLTYGYSLYSKTCS